MDVTKYVLHDENDQPIGIAVWDEDEIEEARAAAREQGAMLIAYVYEYSDSELIDNFLTIPDDCTGYVDQNIGGILHDARGCPVHGG